MKRYKKVINLGIHRKKISVLINRQLKFTLKILNDKSQDWNGGQFDLSPRKRTG